jgi:taurine dioxygenase
MATVVPKLSVEPAHPAVGARVTGADLRDPITNDMAQQIRNAFTEHSVLCFPDQEVTNDNQADFAALFGKADTADRTKEDPDSKQSKRGVMYVSNIREEGKPIGVLPDGEMHFHSDGAHRDKPYRATTLFAIEVPNVGGETKFAGLAAAYEALPAAQRGLLDTLEARHVFNYNKTTREEMRRDDDVSHAIHPLVKVHPDSGRKSLYVSRLMTCDIVGMVDEQSEDLLLSLFDHCERPEFVYAHSWTPGDLVIWDNRSVNHARNDFPADQRRLLRRYTVSEPD